MVLFPVLVICLSVLFCLLVLVWYEMRLYYEHKNQRKTEEELVLYTTPVRESFGEALSDKSSLTTVATSVYYEKCLLPVNDESLSFICAEVGLYLKQLLKTKHFSVKRIYLHKRQEPFTHNGKVTLQALPTEHVVIWSTKALCVDGKQIRPNTLITWKTNKHVMVSGDEFFEFRVSRTYVRNSI